MFYESVYWNALETKWQIKKVFAQNLKCVFYKKALQSNIKHVHLDLTEDTI